MKELPRSASPSQILINFPPFLPLLGVQKAKQKFSGRIKMRLLNFLVVDIDVVVMVVVIVVVKVVSMP